MRINVLQHTPSEGPGSIADWASAHGHELYIYHPYQFNGVLPTAAETDLLVILGGPMSPNDDLDWIENERQLIKQLLAQHKPIFGACYGAQQIAKTLGYGVLKAPHKEVGWAPVYRQATVVPGLPEQLTALHWHEEMFEVPRESQLLFTSDLVHNQGFVLGDNVIGLQFHLEPKALNVRTMVVNDGQYAMAHNDLHQTPETILKTAVPVANRAAIDAIFDFLTNAH
ncbi:glutamine amidotransferase [Secundilactobacillus pentosiphilus]|uniref:Glutamine amidotransferase n=1 Tax=Secundilactobacillus pentosiphilus TaxID=1714682 RepID=A0A1Z5IT37_9LACO|nr:type 1 glutamine amidotransferase [Secundilactobacillus pentosiphilus]GAX04899.1 glutamine amidotransferase [Secundilactobacillus pentosiphilus]